MATVPVRISRRGLGKVILGPCAPCTATLAVLTMSFMVSCDTGISKTSRPQLSLFKILNVLRFFCLFVCLFHFVWYCLYINSQVSFVILKTSTDVKRRKGPGGKRSKPVDSQLRAGHSEEEQKGPTWFLR